ncbi:MAG: helix-hairpin-helix domain-containing protein [Pseudomonadales bacterium]|nr:helix-hairpin-helix domain-containing protein [Pseudomonadales bacterium]
MIKGFRVALLWLGLSFAGFVFADGKAMETVNVNKADAETIARVLTGIGDAKAQAIVRYREEHGEFVDVYELANVKGVGERTVELNEGRIVLKD